MASRSIKAVIPDIDGLEREMEEAPEPIADVIPFMIPVPTYRAMSEAASKKNMTVAQLFAQALSHILSEE